MLTPSMSQSLLNIKVNTGMKSTHRWGRQAEISFDGIKKKEVENFLWEGKGQSNSIIASTARVNELVTPTV